MSQSIDIKEFKNFLDRDTCAYLLKKIYQKRELWENRQDRKVSYRNGDWYTIGSAIYLDSAMPPAEYAAKIKYWNSALRTHFGSELITLSHFMTEKVFKNLRVRYLADVVGNISLPGFHIFEGNETLGMPFGKAHRDLQWQSLGEILGYQQAQGEPLKPQIKMDLATSHFSITLVLRLPYLGGALRIEGSKDYSYNEGSFYLHTGQFTHMIAPYAQPVLPTDARITLQAHGFMYENEIYLYW